MHTAGVEDPLRAGSKKRASRSRSELLDADRLNANHAFTALDVEQSPHSRAVPQVRVSC